MFEISQCSPNTQVVFLSRLSPYHFINMDTVQLHPSHINLEQRTGHPHISPRHRRLHSHPSGEDPNLAVQTERTRSTVNASMSTQSRLWGTAGHFRATAKRGLHPTGNADAISPIANLVPWVVSAPPWITATAKTRCGKRGAGCGCVLSTRNVTAFSHQKRSGCRRRGRRPASSLRPC